MLAKIFTYFKNKLFFKLWWLFNCFLNVIIVSCNSTNSISSNKKNNENAEPYTEEYDPNQNNEPLNTEGSQSLEKQPHNTKLATLEPYNPKNNKKTKEMPPNVVPDLESDTSSSCADTDESLNNKPITPICNDKKKQNFTTTNLKNIIKKTKLCIQNTIKENKTKASELCIMLNKYKLPDKLDFISLQEESDRNKKICEQAVYELNLIQEQINVINKPQNHGTLIEYITKKPLKVESLKNAGLNYNLEFRKLYNSNLIDISKLSFNLCETLKHNSYLKESLHEISSKIENLLSIVNSSNNIALYKTQLVNKLNDLMKNIEDRKTRLVGTSKTYSSKIDIESLESQILDKSKELLELNTNLGYMKNAKEYKKEGLQNLKKDLKSLKEIQNDYNHDAIILIKKQDIKIKELDIAIDKANIENEMLARKLDDSIGVVNELTTRIKEICASD